MSDVALRRVAEDVRGLSDAETYELLVGELVRRRRKDHTRASLSEITSAAVLELARGIGRTEQILPSADQFTVQVLTQALAEAASNEPAQLTEGERARIAALRDEVREDVLLEDLVDANQAGELLGHSGDSRRWAAGALRRSGKLVGVRTGNKYLYPRFQFDQEAKRVHSVVAEVNVALDAASDPWAVTSWWTAPHPALPEGTAPKELVGSDQEHLLRRLAPHDDAA